MTNDKLLDAAVGEFVSEGREILDRVSVVLQEIEKNNGQGTIDQVSALYRDMHTLKGTAQLFGFKTIGLVSHAMEASLDPVRKGTGKVPPRLMDSCLKNLDVLERLLKSVGESGNENADAEIKNVTDTVSLLVDAATDYFNTEFKVLRDDFNFNEVPVGNPKLKKASLEDALSAISDSAPAKVETMTPKQESPPQPIKIEPTVEQRQPVVETQAPDVAVQVQQTIAVSNPIESTIRVQVSLLDRILNLVAELVLVRNQLLQYRNKLEDTEFLNTSKILDVITSDLQSEVLKTRMQPIETVVSKFNRLVRDLSKELGKKIDLTLEGADTELDKSLLEAIKDPLTHIVRNSCDHGVETPEERKKAAKPENGHLLIRSFHEGGQVVIEISDDGRGLDRQKLLKKALEKGLLTQEKASKLNDRETMELIFAPGFSTAAQVTNVSGRGVGMDVVKTNIEKIGGSVELSSVHGKGTTLQLRIPLTLAIVPALLVRSSNELYAIPQVKLVELVRVGGEDSQAKIEYLQGKPMYRLRGALLPLLDVADVIKGVPIKTDVNHKDDKYIVVLNAESEYFGLLVSEILDTADIVVKPLPAFLKHLSIFSGATILGDGSIALILDIAGVAQHGNVLRKRNKEESDIFAKGEKKGISADIQEFLLFSIGTDTTHSVPLCLVQRLEEFNVADLEYSGDQKVAKYRGSLLPILNLKEILKYNSKQAKSGEPKERISVFVVSRSGRSFGLEVDDILDVVTIDSQIDDKIRDRNGILGNLLFNDKVVVVVDALGIIEAFDSKINPGASKKFDSNDTINEIKNRNKEIKFKKIRVLYAEDVAFFRKHVSKVLNEAGIDVTTVDDGRKAIEELDSVDADKYNLILSDIEMPRLDGVGLAREVRKRDKFKNIPMIALTTRFKEKDIAEGKAAGFNIYLEKLNPDKLMEAINVLMSPNVNSTNEVKL